MKALKFAFPILAVAALIVALPASESVEGKGHVPLNKVQVCHDGDFGGEVITVSKNALDAHLNHGDCQLPACDFNNVFHTGETCDANNAGGRCTLANPRDGADGITPGCPAGTF